MIERRYNRAAALSVKGRTLSGVVMPYGETAVMPFGGERFEPGAFRFDDVILNRMHIRAAALCRTGGGGLSLIDSLSSLSMRAILPDTTDARDCLALVKSGVLRGLSVEFDCISDRLESSVRVIERAQLRGIGVVDSPAFSGAIVEARAKGRRVLTASIPVGRKVDCECAGDCKQVMIGANAAAKLADVFDREFTQVIDRGIGEIARDIAAGRAREVIAVHGSYSRPLASAGKGTLRLRDRGADGLGVEVDLPAGPAGDAVAADMESTGIVIRPYISERDSEFTEEGPLRTYQRAHVRSMIVGATDASGGWPTPELNAATGKPNRPRRPARRRRYAWL